MRIRRGGAGGVGRLFVGLGVMIGLIAAAQYWSPTLPGAAGEVYRNNASREYAPYAYVYTEVTGVAAFLDDQCGRYGRGAFSPHRWTVVPTPWTVCPAPDLPGRDSPGPAAGP